jgi:hypothetical protein
MEQDGVTGRIFPRSYGREGHRKVVCAKQCKPDRTRTAVERSGILGRFRSCVVGSCRQPGPACSQRWSPEGLMCATGRVGVIFFPNRALTAVARSVSPRRVLFDRGQTRGE